MFLSLPINLNVLLGYVVSTKLIFYQVHIQVARAIRGALSMFLSSPVSDCYPN